MRLPHHPVRDASNLFGRRACHVIEPLVDYRAEELFVLKGDAAKFGLGRHETEPVGDVRCPWIDHDGLCVAVEEVL